MHNILIENGENIQNNLFMKAYQKKQGPQGDQEQSGKTRSIDMYKMGLVEEGDRDRERERWRQFDGEAIKYQNG